METTIKIEKEVSELDIHTIVASCEKCKIVLFETFGWDEDEAMWSMKSEVLTAMEENRKCNCGCVIKG